MNPSPVDDTHLYLQATHRSQAIWDTSSTVVLSCRRREAVSQHTIPFDQCIAPYLEATGFLGVSQGVHDHAVRCCSAVGVPVDGEPLTGSLRYNWKFICEDFLGVLPPNMKGQRLSVSWLVEQFEELPPDADVVSIQRYAGTYAWDVATLAWLYKELCRASHAQSLEIADPFMLLQVWAYNRFSIVAP
ncbi:serine/threonine-protein phosphatase 7 long form-like protein [Cucumis melo var. makuwa]|uniref:Serine/threonine-protein phosphatase 7 long form-like protein n=1 Tax=Cucumis melo var. makuwa TaxID=1194695 RepID=A0A5D3CEG0_CUCMM|nr:serine/threonine-protein phosphatase 7 long form-like protein [Cucumis melo var. makuwa]